MPYQWSETNPYKFNFLTPAGPGLEEMLEADIRQYSETQWKELGYTAIVFTLSMYHDLTGERRFFACISCPATVTAQGVHSFHLTEANNERYALQLCDHMAEVMDGPQVNQEDHIPKSEAHLWN